MAADPWEIDRLDLADYLKRLSVPEREPSREALAELHEAHVRAFTFDNIDVLLGQHPGGWTSTPCRRSSSAAGGAGSVKRSSASFPQSREYDGA